MPPNVALRTLCLAVCFFALPLPAIAQYAYNIVSGASWQATDMTGSPLDSLLSNAQNVCIGTNPANCATGATQYGGSFDPWITSLPGISGATWMWAPGVTGA